MADSLDENVPSGENSSLIDVQSEEASNDGDSACGSDAFSSKTASITSTVLDYEYENGRRYQRMRDGRSYIFPNDEKEQDRLDMLHHIYLLMLGGCLHTAPISHPQRVLDLGTGTGIWALDFADEFPESDVIGVDISPMQPVWVAPNCRFIVDDITEPWIYSPTQPFSYIHQRSMAGSITNWVHLYSQALQHLEPGGWLEAQEYDVWFYSQTPQGLGEDSAIMRWQKLIDEASIGIGRKLNCAGLLGRSMEEAGFGKVKSQVLKIPIGTWPRNAKLKELGKYLQMQMMDALEPVTIGYLSRVLQWREEEMQVLLAQVRNEFRDNSLHLYCYCRFYVGQKAGGNNDEG